MVDLGKLKGPADWPKARTKIEEEIQGLLGAMPKPPADLQVKTVDEIDFRGYSRRRVNYFIDGWNRVAAWVFLPEGKEEVPAILCCHQEVGQGKDEPAGLDGESRFAFAQHYAQLGYATIAPDCVTAGDRVSSRLPPLDSKAYYKDHPKLSVLGRMLHDHMQALSVISEMRRVDPARLGVVGHGLGAANALLLAAFDERVQTCVASCGFTRFETDKDAARWARDEGLVLLPGLKPMIESGKFTFDWEHILALAAPTATLVITSLTDAEFVNPKSCQKAVGLASKVYKMLGAASAIDPFAHHDGHTVTPETLEVADEWFDRWI